MHFELLPVWMPLGAVLLTCASAISFLWSRHQARRRRARRMERRIKRKAHAHAWEWVMGRRDPRLTDQRSSPPE